MMESDKKKSLNISSFFIYLFYSFLISFTNYSCNSNVDFLCLVFAFHGSWSVAFNGSVSATFLFT